MQKLHKKQGKMIMNSANLQDWFKESKQLVLLNISVALNEKFWYFPLYYNTDAKITKSK